MSNYSPRILLIVVGIALSLGAAWSLRYFSGIEPFTALTKSYVQPGLGQVGLQATETRIIGYDRGKTRWRMAARTLTFSRDRRSLAVEGIRQGTLYDSRGRPIVSITADHALWQTQFGTLDLANSGMLRLDGGIVARVNISDHPVLQSQSLIWDSQRNTITSPGTLTAAVPRLTITAGTGDYAMQSGLLSASPGDLHLRKGIQATFQGRYGSAILSCSGLDWDAAHGIGRSLGPVSARLPGEVGAAVAADVEADTRTGNLLGHGFQGTLLLSTEVQ